MERKRTECPALPPGWKKEEVIRKSGLSAGKSDVYYYSPTGKKFRSKPQLARYLGNAVDLACFDFRTGKMMPGKLQKNKQRFRHDAQSLAKGGKPDLNTTLPIRQTASIFKQPVTKVTSHPGNKVKTDLQRGVEQPRQGAGAEGVPGPEESGGGADGRQRSEGRRKHPGAAGKDGLKTDRVHLSTILRVFSTSNQIQTADPNPASSNPLPPTFPLRKTFPRLDPVGSDGSEPATEAFDQHPSQTDAVMEQLQHQTRPAGQLDSNSL
ncbi:methyl-CpG-binding domain protein 2 isoform 1-T2 [Anableps anableps]